MTAGISCEGTQSLLQCGGGEVLNIVTARYGRFDLTTCPHQSINEIDCESPDTYDVIRSLCQNKSSCTVTSSTSQYSGEDPCPGTHKYLNVTYTCQYQRKCPLLKFLSFSRFKLSFLNWFLILTVISLSRYNLFTHIECGNENYN